MSLSEDTEGRGKERSGLVTVARFQEPASAALARGRLEAEGIESELQDHFTVGVNWLYANAVHGVKVRVAAGKADEARRILEVDRGADLAEVAGGAEEEDHCPHCGSDRLSSYNPVRFLAALTLFPFWPLMVVAGFPYIRWRARHRCLECGKPFRDGGEGKG